VPRVAGAACVADPVPAPRAGDVKSQNAKGHIVGHVKCAPGPARPGAPCRGHAPPRGNECGARRSVRRAPDAEHDGAWSNPILPCPNLFKRMRGGGARAIRNIGHSIASSDTRVYATQLAQPMHTDSADVVGLLCLRSGREGGLSSWASSVSVHNELLRRGRRVRRPRRPAPVGTPWARLALACLAVQARLRHVLRSVHYLLSHRRRHGWTPGPRPSQPGFLGRAGGLRAQARAGAQDLVESLAADQWYVDRKVPPRPRPARPRPARPGACRSGICLPGTRPAPKQATGPPRGTGGSC